MSDEHGEVPAKGTGHLHMPSLAEAQPAATSIGLDAPVPPTLSAPNQSRALTLPPGPAPIESQLAHHSRLTEVRVDRAPIRSPKLPGSGAFERLPADDFPDQPERGFMLPTTIDNVRFMLDSYGIKVRYNLIKKRMSIAVPGHTGSADNFENTSLNVVASLATLNGLSISSTLQFLNNVGDKNQFNPVGQWIDSKPWDGVDRIEAICGTVTARDGFPVAFKDTLIRKWLLSATAAATLPFGFHGRGVLVFQGPQGIGKTSWGRSLIDLPQLRDDVIKLDHHLDGGNKDSIVGAITHWIVEIGELDSSFKKDIARLKGFLTSTSDKVRRPYDRLESEYPRRTVFFATVNENDFLVDPTGNSRWWTIPVERIDFQHGIDVQQLFAQLKVRLEAGDEWWLTGNEETQLDLQNRSHRATSVVRELALEHIDMSRVGHASNPALTPTQFLAKIGIERPTNPQAKEAGAVLRELLGEPKRIQGRNVWRVPLRQGPDVTTLRAAPVDNPDDY